MKKLTLHSKMINKIIQIISILFLFMADISSAGLLPGRSCHCSWWTRNMGGGDSTFSINSSNEQMVAGSVPNIQFTDSVSCYTYTYNLAVDGECTTNMGTVVDQNSGSGDSSQYRSCARVIKGVTLADGTRSMDIACVYSDTSYANHMSGADQIADFNPFFPANSLYPLLIPKNNYSAYDFVFARLNTDRSLTEMNCTPPAGGSNPSTPASCIPATKPANRNLYTAPSTSNAKLPTTCNDLFGNACAPGMSTSTIGKFSNNSYGGAYQFPYATNLAANLPSIISYFTTTYSDNLSPSSLYADPGVYTTRNNSYAAAPAILPTTVGKNCAGAFKDSNGNCYACIALPPGPNPPPLCNPMVVQKPIPSLVNLCGFADYLQADATGKMHFYQNIVSGSSELNQCDLPFTNPNAYNFAKQGVRLVFDNVIRFPQSAPPVNLNAADPKNYYFSTSGLTVPAGAYPGGSATGPNGTENYRILYANTASQTLSYYQDSSGNPAQPYGYDNSSYVDIDVDFSNYASNGKKPATGTITVTDPDNNIGRVFYIGYEIDDTSQYYTDPNKKICLSTSKPVEGQVDKSQIICLPRSAPPKPYVQFCPNGNCSVNNPGITWGFYPNDASAIVTSADVVANLLYDNPAPDSAGNPVSVNYQSDVVPDGVLMTYPYVYDVHYGADLFDTNKNGVDVYSTSSSGKYGCYAVDVLNSGVLGTTLMCGNVYASYLGSNPAKPGTYVVPPNPCYNTTDVTNQCYSASGNMSPCTDCSATAASKALTSPLTYTYASPMEISYSGNAITIGAYNAANAFDSVPVYPASSIKGTGYMCINGFNPIENLLVHMQDKEGNKPISPVSGQCNGRATMDIGDVVLEPGVTSAYNPVDPASRNIATEYIQGVTQSEVGFTGVNPTNIDSYCTAVRTKTNFEANLCARMAYQCSPLPAASGQPANGQGGPGDNFSNGYADWAQAIDGQDVAGTCIHTDSTKPAPTSPTRQCSFGYWQPLDIYPSSCPNGDSCASIDEITGNSSQYGYASWASASSGAKGIYQCTNGGLPASGIAPQMTCQNGQWQTLAGQNITPGGQAMAGGDCPSTVAPVYPCEAINVASSATGWATWPETGGGKVGTGTCTISTPKTGTRTCNSDGTWGEITSPCSLVPDYWPSNGLWLSQLSKNSPLYVDSNVGSYSIDRWINVLNSFNCPDGDYFGCWRQECDNINGSLCISSAGNSGFNNIINDCFSRGQKIEYYTDPNGTTYFMCNDSNQ